MKCDPSFKYKVLAGNLETAYLKGGGLGTQAITHKAQSSADLKQAAGYFSDLDCASQGAGLLLNAGLSHE